MRKRGLFAVGIVGALSLIALVRSKWFNALLVPEYSSRRSVYLANHSLLYPNIISDVLIALGYAVLLTSLCVIAWRLRHLTALKDSALIIAAFMVFIAASGAGTVMRVTTVWWPMYQFSILFKIVSAATIFPAAALFALRTPSMARNVRIFFDLLSTREQERERLRKSEEFLDRTGRLAGIGGWEVDLQTNEVTWSAETCRIHAAAPGYLPTLEEGLSMFPPDARQTLSAAVATASSGGPGWDLELPLIRFDNRRIWARTAGAVDFRDGKPVRLSGAIQDVTSAVEARQALTLANERTTLATDSGGIGIWDWDIVRNTLKCDAWMYRLHGKDPAAPSQPGDLWRDHLHPEDKDFVERALDDAVNGRKDYDTEFRILWKDGSVHNLRGAARVIRDEQGRALNMIGANWDVTESRRLISELEEQHERLRVTLRSIGDGVITTDAHNNVVWLNPIAERMTGWSASNALGQPLTTVFELVDEKTLQAVQSPVLNCFTRSEVVAPAQNARLISLDGSQYGIETSAAPICDSRGELLGSVLVFRDVTEQRRRTAEADHAVALQLKLKDEFLSHVSHELRSPLTSIYSFSSIIADGLAGETTDQQQEYLQIVLKNVVQLQCMIEDLLTVTQSKEGKLSIELQSVSASEAIIDAIHMVHGAASNKKIALSFNDCEDLPFAWADPTRLRQVLIILLDNAIKFTPPEGKVRVTASLNHLGYLLVQVSDTGCGIPKEKWTLVFNKLYQITGPDHADTSQAGRTGLGLGLHIARSLITRQGGNIWVTSKPNEGSIFSFTLPISSERPGTELEFDKEHLLFKGRSTYEAIVG
jgi:PAS domain S-box-containing protein